MVADYDGRQSVDCSRSASVETRPLISARIMEETTPLFINVATI